MRSKYIYTKPTNETTKRRKEEKPKNITVCRLRLMKDSTPDHPFDNSNVFSSIFPLKKCYWMDWSTKISNHDLKNLFFTYLYNSGSGTARVARRSAHRAQLAELKKQLLVKMA